MAIHKSEKADIDPTTVRLALDNVEISFDPALKDIHTGLGKLTISEQYVTWNNDATCLSIDYPSILMHAISRQDPVTLKPSIYCQLDDTLFIDGSEEELVAFEMRLVPSSESDLESIYNALSECSALHPDPLVEDVDLNGDGWVTAENVDSFNTATGLFDRLLDQMEAQDKLNSNGKRENNEDLLR
ncbi:Methylosome subunit pICln [Boothiomyces sp. JEL0866]|nr:Methylosome subunit pICln [Boothiomyces sp. JEL0866]